MHTCDAFCWHICKQRKIRTEITERYKNSMKAIIPVAGIGTRLRPHTHTQPKSLIPLAGKPILAHIIDSLIDAGFKDFVFIIGYLGEKIQTYIEDNYSHIDRKSTRLNSSH